MTTEYKNKQPICRDCKVKLTSPKNWFKSFKASSNYLCSLCNQDRVKIYSKTKKAILRRKIRNKERQEENKIRAERLEQQIKLMTSKRCKYCSTFLNFKNWYHRNKLRDILICKPCDKKLAFRRFNS